MENEAPSHCLVCEDVYNRGATGSSHLHEWICCLSMVVNNMPGAKYVNVMIMHIPSDLPPRFTFNRAIQATNLSYARKDLSVQGFKLI